MLALATPFVKPVVAWQSRKQSKQGRPVPVDKLLEMRLSGRLEQNNKTGSSAERYFGVHQATFLAHMARIRVFLLFLKLKIMIMKLRVDERGDRVEKGVPPMGSGC